MSAAVIPFPRPRKKGRKVGPKANAPGAIIFQFRPRPPEPCEQTVSALEDFLDRARRGEIQGAFIMAWPDSHTNLYDLSGDMRRNIEGCAARLAHLAKFLYTASKNGIDYLSLPTEGCLED